MQIRLAAPCTHDSIVDGPGLRMVVWNAGCKATPLKPCRLNGSCHNPQTHSFKGNIVTTTEAILGELTNNSLNHLTLSGGDPFDNPIANAILAKGARSMGRSVWAYTGYTLEQILQSNKSYWLHLLKNIDVLVDGPFIKELCDPSLDYRGSSNQRIIHVQNEMPWLKNWSESA
jgi:anaerobic ribonucleoside-triphosphate reductase activating protein